MASAWTELASSWQREQLHRFAFRKNWHIALPLIGWLHLAAFALCYYLTMSDYHGATGYLTIWVSELLLMWLILRVCGGRREQAPGLGRFLYRVWLAFFLLAFNLGSMNFLRGHFLFELFPAMASLASFAFIVMTIVIDRQFFLAVLVMFGAGLLMASHLLHAFLIYAVAWWAVLNGIGYLLAASRPKPTDALELPVRGKLVPESVRNEVDPLHFPARAP